MTPQTTIPTSVEYTTDIADYTHNTTHYTCIITDFTHTTLQTILTKSLNFTHNIPGYTHDNTHVGGLYYRYRRHYTHTHTILTIQLTLQTINHNHIKEQTHDTEEFTYNYRQLYVYDYICNISYYTFYILYSQDPSHAQKPTL